MSRQTVETATTELAQAAADYRAGVQAIAANPGLSRQGREDARADLRLALSKVVERMTNDVTPLLRVIETQNEDRLRELSRTFEANEAVARIAMALEQSHPGDLINILTEDGDVAGLLALRQVAPSIAGRFTNVPDDRTKFAETIRHGVDTALASTTTDDSPTGAAVAERFAIDGTRERYLSAINYAVTPDIHGQFGLALSDAMVGA